jgi:hypothetical protein
MESDKKYSFYGSGKTPYQALDNDRQAISHEQPLDDGGQQEWDIYADFNNAGPRYSSAFAPIQNTDR